MAQLIRLPGGRRMLCIKTLVVTVAAAVVVALRYELDFDPTGSLRQVCILFRLEEWFHTGVALV